MSEVASRPEANAVREDGDSQIQAAVARVVVCGAAERRREAARVRNQLLRARRAKGYIVLKAEVLEVALVERLLAIGVLDARDADDRACVEAAFSAVLGDWLAP